MKTFASLFVALLVCLPATSATAAASLNHVVCFKFKSTASSQDIKQVQDAFGQLKTKVPGIEKFKSGTNVSKEQRNKGFTQCWILTFKTEKDRDAYIEHPEHQAFAKKIGAFIDDVFVIDFWNKKE